MEAAQLESRMNTEDYEALKNLFLTSSGEMRSISRVEFINLASANVSCCSEEEFGLLFDGVVMENSGVPLDQDAGKDGGGRVSWTQLRSFLQTELSEKFNTTRVGVVPRWKPPRTLTSPHRDPVHKVLASQSSGRYMTVSKGGRIVVRASGDGSCLESHQLVNCTVRPKDLWVTDMVLLHNINQIAVSFTSREVCFYDVLADMNFSCRYKLQGLSYTPWCLDYWADPSHPDQAFLTVGDTGGQVTVFHFTSAHFYLFERITQQADLDSGHIILWDELIKGKHRSCSTVAHQAHASAWVRKVLYLSELKAFASCSSAARSSLVIGWREKDDKRLRVTSFATKSGVWDLDYHPDTNLLATAGVDHKVRLWNPFIASKPACVFHGHTGPVTSVRFMQTRKQLLSFSKDKVLCVWDLSSQLCVKRLAGVFPNSPEDAHALLVYFEERENVLLTFGSSLVLLEAHEERRRTRSHDHSVTCVLYNGLLRQVVSSDASSRVICWRTDTGQRVRQIHRCHGDASISTMALDRTMTRLFTAGANGEVKLWNFRGHCLCRMNTVVGRTSEISQILLLPRVLLVMGCERLLTAFHLNSFSQPVVEATEWKSDARRGDVLCAAFQHPHTLITGSYHGEISVWSTSTEKVLRKLEGPSGKEGGNNQERFDSSSVVTRLLFLSGRTHVTAAGGADLVSCGGSGVVRLWNTVHNCLMGQFTAHHPELGSIVMAVSPGGKYLVTADRGGNAKMWDIEDYCLEKDDGVTAEAPRLLRTSRLHRGRVTHLEICLHDERLFLLSASADGDVALSDLPGDTVGFFGQSNTAATLATYLLLAPSLISGSHGDLSLTPTCSYPCWSPSDARLQQESWSLEGLHPQQGSQQGH